MGLNKGPADRVAEELPEMALLVSHKGEPAQVSWREGDPQLTVPEPVGLVAVQGGFFYCKQRWKGRRKMDILQAL